jgi:hypothetical protein
MVGSRNWFPGAACSPYVLIAIKLISTAFIPTPAAGVLAPDGWLEHYGPVPGTEFANLASFPFVDDLAEPPLAALAHVGRVREQLAVPRRNMIRRHCVRPL